MLFCCVAITMFCATASWAAGCVSSRNISTGKDGQKYGCCKSGGSYKYDVKKAFGDKITFDFPNMGVCKEKGCGTYACFDPQEMVCGGFSKSNYNAATMTLQDKPGECWYWTCTNSNEAIDKDSGKCVPKDPNAQTGPDGQVLDPCDTTSTVTVKLNGVDKTVPANTRMDGKCVPTCQSDTGSRIDTSDPTEFVITVG